MDWLQFFASIIGNLAWPSAAFAIVMIFRQPFTEILKKLRLKKLEAPGGIKALFDDGLEDADALTAPDQTELPLPALTLPPKESEDCRTSDAASAAPSLRPNPLPLVRDPSLLVLQAFNRLERTLAVVMGEPSGRPSSIWASAFKIGFSSEDLEALRLLRRLRNEVAHSPDTVVDREQAERFIEVAERLILKALELRPPAPPVRG